MTTFPSLPQISPLQSQGKRPSRGLRALFSYCSAVASLQQEKGPSSHPSSGALYPRLVQHSRSHSSFTGGQTWLRRSHRHPPAAKMVEKPPQKRCTLSSIELYQSSSQTQRLPLPVAGNCACRVARMAMLLHFILPGWTVLGTGGHRRGEEEKEKEEEEAPPRAVLVCGRHRKRLRSYEGFRSPPAGFLCLHSL